MNFYYREFLWLVPVVFLFVLFSLLWSYKKRSNRVRQLITPKLRKLMLVSDNSSSKFFQRSLLLSLAAGLLVFSMARPRWGFEWKEVSMEGVDIMVALDVSPSMLSEDIKPNRLRRAKREIEDLVEMLEGDRVGLTVFSGAAFVQCPLTADYSAVAMFLDHINTKMVPIAGTSIGDAINLSISSLTQGESSQDAGKVIILISDGEDQDSQPLEAARKAAEKGIRIYTIGMGSLQGAPIPESRGGFKKDRAGALVVSKLKESQLQEIASITDGVYVRSTTSDFDLQKIYNEHIKQNVNKAKFKDSREKIWYERFFYFSLLCLAILLIEYLWQLWSK